MNNWRIYLNFASHVDLIILVIASANLLLFLMIYCMCTLNRSFLSKITSKYHISLIDMIMTLIVSIIALAFRFLYLVKCINTYFDSSNHASYRFCHFSAFFSLSYIF